MGLITSQVLELWLFRVCWCHLSHPVCPRSSRGLQPCCQQRCSRCCEVSGQLISQLLSLLWGWETPALPPRSEVPVLLVRSSHPALQAGCGYKHVPAALRRKRTCLKFLMRSKTGPSQPGWLLPSHLRCLLFQTQLGADVPCVVCPHIPWETRCHPALTEVGVTHRLQSPLTAPQLYN